MRLKLTILTILVALLATLSIYGVSARPDRGPVNFSLVRAEETHNFDSQTAYILPAVEPNLFPIRRSEFTDPPLAAKAFLLYEIENGKIVLAQNSKQPLPVASLTKILTAVLAMENLSLDEVVIIGPDSRNVDQEGADFYLGEKVYVKDLLAAILIKSSNDAAVALSKAVEKKTDGHFIAMMNQKASAIGMVSSSFLDPSGLNDNGYSTAEDLLKLARYSKKYKLIWQMLGSRSWEMRSTDGKLAHHFLSTNKLFDVVPGLIGGKTGYTEGALGGMILEVERYGTHGSFVAVVLGSPSRFEDAKKLIEWGRAAFRWE